MMNCNNNYYFWTVLIAAVIIFAVYGNNGCGCDNDHCC